MGEADYGYVIDLDRKTVMKRMRRKRTWGRTIGVVMIHRYRKKMSIIFWIFKTPTLMTIQILVVHYSSSSLVVMNYKMSALW